MTDPRTPTEAPAEAMKTETENSPDIAALLAEAEAAIAAYHGAHRYDEEKAQATFCDAATDLLARLVAALKDEGYYAKCDGLCEQRDAEIASLSDALVAARGGLQQNTTNPNDNAEHQEVVAQTDSKRAAGTTHVLRDDGAGSHPQDRQVSEAAGEAGAGESASDLVVNLATLVALATERSLHAAWRKRAEEAERELVLLSSPDAARRGGAESAWQCPHCRASFFSPNLSAQVAAHGDKCLDPSRLDRLQAMVEYHASRGEDREAVAYFDADALGLLESALVDSEGNLRAALDTAFTPGAGR